MSRSPFDIPLATYRLQFHRDFTFDQATAIVPYLARLGISHVYASPFLKARAGSTHGYDVVDYNRLNPELGDEASFDHFCAALESHSMGLVLDFVPNHMGVGKADNPWWLDVLEWGQASLYAGHFDIDWSPAKGDLEGKVLLPILGQVYGAALSEGAVAPRFSPEEGTLDLWYHDHRLPISPRDYADILAPVRKPAALEQALDRLELAVLAKADPASLRIAAASVKAALAVAVRDPEMVAAIEAALSPWRGKAGEPASFTALHTLLQRQAYRLAHWRAAADEINYRRFFDIDNLAGVRMDRVRVFRDSHELVGKLLAQGRLQGLRIDHVDGMADPLGYCRRLNAFAAAIVPRSPLGVRLRPYILVEKILAGGEALRREWPIAGTTGYDYLVQANGLFIEPSGHARLQRHWRRFTGLEFDLDREIYLCRRLVIDSSLSSELTYLVNWLVDIAEKDWFTRDFTRKRLRDALTEIVAAFAVYRTYVTERGANEADRAEISRAVAAARGRWLFDEGEILTFIESLLTLDIRTRHPDHYAAAKAAILRFVTRFQQYTGAIAAKAVEDTLFYRYAPLGSANEVGADPQHPCTSIADWHQGGIERCRDWPHAMLASETHDTKRGEDVRARLDVLSEMPDEWARRIARWHLYNRTHLGEAEGQPSPSSQDEFLLYQTIVGTWPMRIGSILRSESARKDYVERLKTYALKASREAKLSTSWTRPSEAYEQAFLAFIEGIFADAGRSPFLDSVTRFLPPIRRLGAINGLAQLVLKATMPGMPDFYQGSEFWDLSLVDPDNRRPVDYTARVAALRVPDLDSAKRRWRDGPIKLLLTRRLLALRNRLPALFRSGSYRPLAVTGPGQNNIVAYARQEGDAEIVVVVSRFLANRLRGDATSLWSGEDIFTDTRIEGVTGRNWVDQFSGIAIEPNEQGLDAAQALSQLPVAVLLAD